MHQAQQSILETAVESTSFRIFPATFTPTTTLATAPACGLNGTYSYDALSRMTLRSTTPYTYNGDGALVQDATTRYTHDLASPLSQVLQTTQGATTKYLYGLDCLAAQSVSAKTWYVGDALGSATLGTSWDLRAFSGTHLDDMFPYRDHSQRTMMAWRTASAAA